MGPVCQGLSLKPALASDTWHCSRGYAESRVHRDGLLTSDEPPPHHQHHPTPQHSHSANPAKLRPQSIYSRATAGAQKKHGIKPNTRKIYDRNRDRAVTPESGTFASA